MTAFDWRARQTRTSKLIASGSTGTNAFLLIYPFASALNNSGTLDPTKFTTGSIGQDIFVYISGAIGSLDGITHGAAVTGGDLHVSGNLRVQGSLLFSSGSVVEFGLTDYAATTNGYMTIVGQRIFNAPNYSATPIYLNGVLASHPSGSVSVQLYNVGTGQYVDIGGVGIKHFMHNSNTPLSFSSTNLVGASGFSATKQIYELHMSVSNPPYPGYAGGWVFAVTGAGLQGPSGSTGSSGGADPGASFVVISTTASLANERALAAGPGITINDGGAGSNVTISASLLAGPGISINQVGNSYAISASVTSSVSGGTDTVYAQTVLFAGQYVVSASTNPFIAGAKFYVQEHGFPSSTQPVKFRGVAVGLATTSAKIQLFSSSALGYVGDLDGLGNDFLVVSGVGYHEFVSVDLTGHTNFSTSTDDIYIVTVDNTGSDNLSLTHAELTTPVIVATSGTGSSSQFISSSVVTTNGTATLLATYALSPNTLGDLSFQIIGKQNTFANYARWQRNIVVGRSGSDVAFVHASSSYAPIGDVATTGSWGFNFLASGNDIRLYVTGATSTTVSWSCQFAPLTT